jgi:type III secretion protein V
MAQSSFSAWAQRRPFAGADAALAILFVSVVGLMIVPLPTWLLDVLLASNLAISVAILLVTLYVGSALEIATFPTLLLITTLVRIALNVSSTRLILLHADAGEVIRAFGTFVVSGNYVVGAVVFLIITIVQLVVVARGSERVAEVGARFTLDALPGKQMAIDAELRAGSLDAEGARVRRRLLERESHFYGAMDGAVKFVKGDVVASILIAIVNIVGGVAIGVGQHGLPVSTALERYGLLTIGDGLVTQIPALLLSTAAGILVTRVASEEPATPLGAELSLQLFGVPRALGVAALLVVALALVPGLPAVPFLAIGVLLGLASRAGHRAKRDEARHAPLFDDSGERTFVSILAPWSLEVSQDVERALAEHDRDPTALPNRLRSRVFQERGVLVPQTRIDVDSLLPPGHVVLTIHEVPARVLEVQSGLPSAEVAAFVEAQAARLLVDRAGDFLGIAETKALLDGLERRSPATVRAVVPKLIDVAALADVLRRLVEERVSVRDLTLVLEALARAPITDRDPGTLTECVRGEMRRALTFDVTSGAPELEVVLLDSNIEDTIQSAISKTSAGTFFTLAPAASRDVIAAIRRALGDGDGDKGGGGGDKGDKGGSGTGRDHQEAKPPVVLTRPDIRRFVRKLLETDLPDVRVLSFGELLPEIVVKPRGRATLAGL